MRKNLLYINSKWAKDELMDSIAGKWEGQYSSLCSLCCLRGISLIRRLLASENATGVGLPIGSRGGLSHGLRHSRGWTGVGGDKGQSPRHEQQQEMIEGNRAGVIGSSLVSLRKPCGG